MYEVDTCTHDVIVSFVQFDIVQVGQFTVEREPVMPAIRSTKKDARDHDLMNGTAPTLVGEADYAAANYVRTNFASVVGLSRNEKAKILITEHNYPAAAVVPVSQYRILKFLDSIGITDALSDITYTEVSFEDAIQELSKIIERVQLAAGGKTEEQDDGRRNSLKAETES